MPWEHFDHEADIGIRGTGATLDEAFAQAALALMHVMVEPETVRESGEVAIHCEAPDPEFLLVRWLNALIFEMDRQKWVFRRFEVSVREGYRLEARAWGEKADPLRHNAAVDVKGATLTELKVARTAVGWLAQCVVDV